MGVDIHGWVEANCLPWTGRWAGVVKIDALLPRDYDAFGCLFGVMNFAHFRPLAAGRGLPEGLSEEAQQDAEVWRADSRDGELLAPTWMSWTGILGIDVDEWAEHPDSRLHPYVRDQDGALRPFGMKAAWQRAISPHLGISFQEAMTNPRIHEDGQEWEADGVVYRAERLQRKDALTGRWLRLFQIMRTLADELGDENVRLVVWFDR